MPPILPFAGYIRRFVGKDRKVLYGASLSEATEQALVNIESFWLVGVVEQYAGFLEVLRHLLDPHNDHPELWTSYEERRYNT